MQKSIVIVKQKIVRFSIVLVFFITSCAEENRRIEIITEEYQINTAFYENEFKRYYDFAESKRDMHPKELKESFQKVNHLLSKIDGFIVNEDITIKEFERINLFIDEVEDEMNLKLVPTYLKMNINKDDTLYKELLKLNLVRLKYQIIKNYTDIECNFYY